MIDAESLDRIFPPSLAERLLTGGLMAL